MSLGHWSPWKRKVLTRRKENSLEVIEKTQLGCGLIAIVSNSRVSIETGVLFEQKVGFPNKINESLMKIIEKSLRTAKIDRKIAESEWI
jgi:hypothetical protein